MRLLYFVIIALFISCGDAPVEDSSGGIVGGTQELVPDDFFPLREKENLEVLCSALESKDFFITGDIARTSTEMHFQLARRSCTQTEVQTQSFSSPVEFNSRGLELSRTPSGAFRSFFTHEDKLIQKFCNGSLVGDIERFQKFGNRMVWLTVTDKASEGCSGRSGEVCAIFTSGIKRSGSTYDVVGKESILVNIDEGDSSEYGVVLNRAYESNQLCSGQGQAEFTEQTFIGFSSN